MSWARPAVRRCVPSRSAARRTPTTACIATRPSSTTARSAAPAANRSRRARTRTSQPQPSLFGLGLTCLQAAVRHAAGTAARAVAIPDPGPALYRKQGLPRWCLTASPPTFVSQVLRLRHPACGLLHPLQDDPPQAGPADSALPDRPYVPDRRRMGRWVWRGHQHRPRRQEAPVRFEPHLFPCVVFWYLFYCSLALLVSWMRLAGIAGGYDRDSEPYARLPRSRPSTHPAHTLSASLLFCSFPSISSPSLLCGSLARVTFASHIPIRSLSPVPCPVHVFQVQDG